MRQIDVYEPALCCSSGLCGTDVDQALVDFNAALTTLEKEGITVTRRNLASAPTDFATCEPVRAYVEVAGTDGLPVTVVDGTIVATGSYPQVDQLRQFAGVSLEEKTTLPVVESGCCGESGCC